MIENNFPQQNIEKKNHFNNWTKVPLVKEEGELERVLNTFYDKSFLSEHGRAFLDYIYSIYEKSELKDLADDVWSTVENTQSVDVRHGDYDKLHELIGEKRDFNKIIDSFDNDNVMEAPIIAHFPDGKYHLISGNTRLCVAKTKSITPKVVILEIPTIDNT